MDYCLLDWQTGGPRPTPAPSPSRKSFGWPICGRSRFLELRQGKRRAGAVRDRCRCRSAETLVTRLKRNLPWREAVVNPHVRDDVLDGFLLKHVETFQYIFMRLPVIDHGVAWIPPFIRSLLLACYVLCYVILSCDVVIQFIQSVSEEGENLHSWSFSPSRITERQRMYIYRLSLIDKTTPSKFLDHHDQIRSDLGHLHTYILTYLLTYSPT